MKVPTFVPSLDTIVKGGLPEGSSVLLLGQPGSGNFEFSISSAANLSRAIGGHVFRELVGYEVKILRGIVYVSFSKPRGEVSRIISLSLEEKLASDLLGRMEILDYSRIFYQQTQVPLSWIGGGPTLRDREGLISSFIRDIEKVGKEKMIIVDSLTDLFTSRYSDENVIFDLARGLSRASKMWNSLIYVLMSSGIADKRAENILMEIFDGTMLFEWGSSERTSRRKRYMSIPRFIGVLPQIEAEKIERFEAEFDYNSGMVVLNLMKVR
ncbi:MAG: RAD55 family ATPase [Thermoplasmata archaeon]